MKKIVFSLAIASVAAGAIAMNAIADSPKSQLKQAGKEFEQLSHGQGVYTPESASKHQWRKAANSQGSEVLTADADPLSIIEAAYQAADESVPMVPEYPAFTGTVPDSLVVTTVADNKPDDPKVTYSAHLYWMSNDGFSGTEKRYYYGNMMKLEYGTALGDNVFTYSYQNGQKGPVFYRRSQLFNPATNKITGATKYHVSVDATTIKPDTIFDYSRISYCEAYDPSTGAVFGCYMSVDGKSIEFGVLEIADITQPRITIAPMEKPWMACAIDMDGTMYAIEQGGALCKVDKATGATTKVADTGFAATDRTSGVMDIKTGIFYYFYSDEANNVANLYAIDVRDAYKISVVYTFPYWARIGAMINLTNQYVYTAPAAPTAATFTFEEGSLQGKAKFTMPSTALDGTDLTGAIRYDVTAAGKVLASGTAQPGAEVEADITVPAKGNYIFRVSASTDKGRSPYFRTAAVSWVGNDVPVAPANLKTSYDREAKKMTLSWDSVKTSSHKGYIDPKNVKYNVTRTVYGSDTTSAVVATDLAGVEFTEDMDFPDELQLIEYAVEASYEGVTGASAKAEMHPIGRIIAPYLDDFSNVAAFKHYTVIDGGTKGSTNFQNIWANSSEPKYYSSPKPAAQKAALYSSSSAPKDDWLITAPIYFKKGLTYKVNAEIAQYISSSGEIISVMLGTEPTAEAMTTTLMEATTLTCAANNPLKWSYEVEVPEDGEYFIGFHATSPKYKKYITIDNIEIEKPFVTLGPNVPTDVVIDGYQYDGSPKVTIGFHAPAINNKGLPLTSLTKIEIKRDGEVVKTMPTPTFGDSITYVDTCPKLGNYTYRITAYNEHGEGKYVEQNVYTGVYFGARTDSVRISEDPSRPGIVTVEWDTVTTDAWGRDIDPSLVRYTILADIGDPRGMVLVGEEGISGNKVQFNALLDNRMQANVYCRIISLTDAGYMGNGYGGFAPQAYNTSRTICVGYPYDMPIMEDGSVTTNWTYTTAGGQWYGRWKPDWVITNGDFFEIYGIPALDNNSYAFAWPYYYDASIDHEYTIFTDAKTSFFTGKINISDSEFSAMQFYFYDDSAWEDVYEFYPIVHTNDGDVALTQPIYTGQSEEAGWKRVSVSLDKYRGQVAQLGIHVNYLGSDKGNRQNFFIIDGIQIREFANEDLWAASLQVPTLVVGEDNELLATVRNLGYNASGKAAVELYRNDKLVETKDLSPLQPNDIATVSFIQTPDLFWTGSQEFQVKVAYTPDQVLGNNASDIVTAPLKESTLARVTDLKATSEALDVELAWSAPVVPSEAIVDGAESYAKYSYRQIGDFTLVDVDGLPVSPFVPGNLALDVPMAWMVWEDDATSQYQFAHTGKKCFVAFTNGNYGPNEDWLILPRLNGKAQTIKFWANGEMDLFGEETFDVLYSTTGLDLSCFETLGDTLTANAAGAEFSFDVPDGTEYFAIRYFGNGNNLALFVDDIEFKPFGTDATITGYDIYRDQVKINEALVTELTYSDAVKDEGKYTYHVVANYVEGASRISNKATVQVTKTGIADAEASVKVGVEGHCIVVAGAQGLNIAVASADGKVMASEIGADINRIEASAGVYIVTVGAKAYKVAVK